MTQELRFPSGWSAPRHEHPELWELVLVTEGMMGVTIDGKETRGGAGFICIYPPKLPHRETCLSRTGLHLAILLWTGPSEAGQAAVQGFDSDGHVQRTLRWMNELQSQVGPRHAMLDRLLEVTLFECRRSRTSEDRQRFSGVIRHVREHLAEPVSVPRLAKIAHMSESHFAHAFRRETGLAPMAYVRKLRLEHACKAIARGTATFRQIAQESGFRDEFEFSRVFRRVMGTTPSSLRANGR